MLVDTRRDIATFDDLMDLEPSTVLEAYRHDWIIALKYAVRDHDEDMIEFIANGIMGFQYALEKLGWV